jgi:hypothetical protein
MRKVVKQFLSQMWAQSSHSTLLIPEDSQSWAADDCLCLGLFWNICGSTNKKT